MNDHAFIDFLLIRQVLEQAPAIILQGEKGPILLVFHSAISRSPLDKNPMPGHLFELHPVNEVNTKGQ